MTEFFPDETGKDRRFFFPGAPDERADGYSRIAYRASCAFLAVSPICDIRAPASSQSFAGVSVRTVPRTPVPHLSIKRISSGEFRHTPPPGTPGGDIGNCLKNQKSEPTSINWRRHGALVRICGKLVPVQKMRTCRLLIAGFRTKNNGRKVGLSDGVPRNRYVNSGRVWVSCEHAI